jgi:uncharacterized protein (DUF58 family)
VRSSAVPSVARLLPETITARAVPAGRLPVACGPRLFVLLLTGLVWMGPAWLDHRFVYVMLAWNGLVALAWLADFTRLPKPGEIEVSRQWLQPLALCEPASLKLIVRCAVPLPLRVRVLHDVPESFCSAPRLTESLPEVHLPPGDFVALNQLICPVSRGDFEAGNIYLCYQSPLRLAERRALARLKQTVRVYPNLRESEQFTLYLIRSRQIELEKRLKRKTGAGREFESLRDYREGDEPRDICWTATARRAKLITRTYRVERSQPVVLVVDAGRLLLARVQPASDSTLGPPGSDQALPSKAELPPAADDWQANRSESRMRSAPGPALAKLDYSINAALSLARVALYSGDAVGLTVYSRTLQARLPVARGSARLRAVLEGLAQVQGELVEGDHQRAASHLLSTQKQRSLIVWLTDFPETAATPEVLEAASRLLARHLVLFVAIGQPELRQLVARKPLSVRQAYRYVAAMEMMERRDLLLRRLRRQGALALELEPGELAPRLVNQYLEIKERSLL